MRKILRGVWKGAILGLALNQIVNLLASYWLRLGYYAPCLAPCLEMFGGELNAALAQMLAFAVVFGGAGAFIPLGRPAIANHRGGTCPAGKGMKKNSNMKTAIQSLD